MLHPDLPKMLRHYVEKEIVDSNLQKEIQKKLIESGSTDIRNCYKNIIKPQDKIERIISTFGVLLNSENRESLLNFFLTNSKEYAELWLKEYIKGYKEGKLPLDEQFFMVLFKQENTEKLIELILDNVLEKEKIISLLITLGLQKGNAKMLQYVKLKEPFYSAALKNLNLAPKEKEKLDSLLQFSPHEADFYSKTMAEFSYDLGDVTLHGGLLYAAEVNQRKKISSRSPEEQYTFDPTILEPNEFSEYLTILKQASFPIRERFVVTGDHWICGEIIIDKGECKILIIDSLGLKGGGYPSTIKIIDQCADIFPSSEIYLDATIRQHSSSGCYIFALDDVRHLYTVERHIPESSLFRYLKKNAKKDVEKRHFKLTNLPLPFMRTMQSSKLIARNESGVMSSRSESEKVIPLGKQKGSARHYMEEGYKKDFAQDPKLVKLINKRVERKLKKMRDYIDGFLIKNIKNGEAFRPMMEPFSLKGLHEKLAKKQKLYEHQEKIIAESELHAALRKMESLDNIITLLERGENVNLPNSDGDTPLHIALQKGAKSDIIQVLLKSGANVNLPNLDGDTSLHIAILAIRETGIVEEEAIPRIFSMLLDVDGVNVNYANKRGETPLKLVLQDIGKKGQGIVRALLEKGAEVNLSDTWQELPLSKAMSFGADQDVVLAIIKKTKDVNFGFKDIEGDSILHRVLADKNYNQNSEIINELLKRKADVNRKGRDGMTPLQHAIEGNAPFPIIQMLLDQEEININLADTKGRTPLETAFANKREDVIQTLLKKGANIKFTTLHTAFEKQLKPELILLLIEGGTDVNLPNSDGDTPLQVAFEKGASPNIINALLKRGANVNVTNSLGNTPLHIALQKGAEPETIEALLKSGANVNLPNSSGSTPLHIAIRDWERIPNIVSMLLDVDDLNLNIPNRRGQTPLTLALEFIGKKGEDIIEKLLKKKGVVFNPTDNDQWTSFPLKKAMDSGVKPAIILAIIKKTENVNCLFTDLGGDSFLHVLLADRNYNKKKEIIDSLENLFSKKAKVNLKGWNGLTPLHCAIERQASLVIIQKLLDHAEIDVNIADNDGRTPLMVAVEENSEDVIKSLLDKGAKITDAELKKAKEISEKIYQLLLKHTKEAEQIEESPRPRF